MSVHYISGGSNLPIEGKPKQEILSSSQYGELFALSFENFQGFKYKLLVKEGDSVNIGSPIAHCRVNTDVLFTSPAGGFVKEIIRGEKRKLLHVIIKKKSKESFEQFPFYEQDSIKKLDRAKLIEQLLRSGLWHFLIERPFAITANPSVVPSSIFINAMETEPNKANPLFLVKNKEKELQMGVVALLKLLESKEEKLFLCYDAEVTLEAQVLANLRNIRVHQFKGKHPAGNTSTHIQKLDRINKGKKVWTITIEQLAYLGEFLLTGKIPVERIVAIAGKEAKNPNYVTTRIGANLKDVLAEREINNPVRVIEGGVLSGTASSRDGFLGFYVNTITLLSENKEQEILGWIKPGGDRHSFTRTFLSSLGMIRKKFGMNTKLNGERRAIIFSDLYDKFVTLDIYTTFLVKACLAEDVEEMEQLGLLECVPEDFSLCTYACVSKVEVDQIIEKGLELLKAEIE